MAITFDPNPFEYSRPLGADDVIDRDDETAALVRLADGKHNVRIAAPRRYGKTSLMAKVFRAAAEDAEMVTILVDLYRVESMADIAIRVERAYAAQLKGKIRDKVAKFLEQSGLGLSLGPVGLNVKLADRSPDNVLPLIHALLDLPRSALEGSNRRALIVLDEFQDIAAVENADGLLRSHIQHQRDVASYIYMGSEPSMLRALFEDRRRPLFEQAVPFDLGPLADRDIAAYVVDRFDQTERDAGEELARLVAVAKGHPQRAMLLAHLLWEHTPRGERAEYETWLSTLEAAESQVADQFAATWQRATPIERKVLRVVASGKAPTGRASVEEFGYTKSHAHEALGRLVDSGELLRDDSGWSFIDPLFERWVAQAAGPGRASPPYPETDANTGGDSG